MAITKGKGLDVEQYIDWMQTNVIRTSQAKNEIFLRNLWNSIVPNTPVRSGLAKFSWRMTAGQKSSYKPSIEGGGFGEIYKADGKFAGYKRVFPDPDPPKYHVFRRFDYKAIFLFNNQDYITELNENEEKEYYQWINDGLDRAVAKSNAEAANNSLDYA